MSQSNNDKVLSDLFLEVLVSGKLLVCKIQDGYFSELLSEGLADLFSNFLEYLKAPSSSTSKKLCLGVDELTQMIDTLHHAQEINKLDYLIIVKSLLSFKNFLISNKNSPQLSSNPSKIKTETVDKLSEIPVPIISKQAPLNSIKKDLLIIIKNKKEVLNLDLFALMPNLTKRSVKRHLSELIHGGYVYRKSLGKKVYYTTKATATLSDQ